MALDDYKVEKESGLPVSFFAMALAGVALIAIAAAVVWCIRGEGEVVTVKRDIPAFTVLEEDDLKMTSVHKQGREIGSVSRDELVGKRTLEALAEGQELDEDDVFETGPRGIGAIRVQVHADRADALELAAGEEVRLWLAPTEESGAGLVICARLLKILEADSPADQSYLVGLSKRNAHRLIDRLGRSRLLITRPG